MAKHTHLKNIIQYLVNILRRLPPAEILSELIVDILANMRQKNPKINFTKLQRVISSCRMFCCSERGSSCSPDPSANVKWVKR